jgi:hypothetical protein
MPRSGLNDDHLTAAAPDNGKNVPLSTFAWEARDLFDLVKVCPQTLSDFPGAFDTSPSAPTHLVGGNVLHLLVTLEVKLTFPTRQIRTLAADALPPGEIDGAFLCASSLYPLVHDAVCPRTPAQPIYPREMCHVRGFTRNSQFDTTPADAEDWSIHVTLDSGLVWSPNDPSLIGFDEGEFVCDYLEGVDRLSSL